MSTDAPALGFDPELLRSVIVPLRSGPALIGLDVDGTLVDHRGHMDPEVRETLHAVREAGHHVVIATGRALGSTLPIVRLAGVNDGWSVSSNGAVTTRILGEADDQIEIVETLTFDPEHALRAMHRAVPEARFAVERPDGSFLATQSFQDMSFGLEALHVEMDALFAEKAVVRVVVTSPDLTNEEFSQVVADAGLHGCEYAIGWSSWLDMSAPGVTKASALEALRVRLGIAPESTLAIGDGSNDVEMLAWAGAGISMGQASPAVHAAANAATLGIDQHGAAHALRLLLD